MIWIPPQVQNNSSIFYPYIESISPIQKNAVGDIFIQGGNFSPYSTVEIENTFINSWTILSDKLIKVNINAPSVVGLYSVTVVNGSLSSSEWGEVSSRYLEVLNNPIGSWFDFRITTPTLLQTPANQPNITYATSQCTTNSDGLTRTSWNTVSGSNFYVLFRDFEFDPRVDHTVEFVVKFSSSSVPIWFGIGDISPSWSNSGFANCLILVSGENRALRKIYGNRDVTRTKNSYISSDVVGEGNWAGNFIHAIIKYSPEIVDIDFRTADTLSWDWNNPTNGTTLQFSNKFVPYFQPGLALCPAAIINNPSSTAMIVGLRVM